MAADTGFTHVRGRLGARRRRGPHGARPSTGEQLAYDVLLVASGAAPGRRRSTARSPSAARSTDQERMHGIVQDVEGGYLRRIAFVVPAGATWPLPLYELALMLAERAFDDGRRRSSCTSSRRRRAPLAIFGAEASREVAELLAEAGIVAAHRRRGRGRSAADGCGSVRRRRRSTSQRIVTLPRLEGPAIAGLPADADGFLVTDAHAPRAGRARRLRRRRRHRRSRSSRAASPASRPTRPPPTSPLAPARRSSPSRSRRCCAACC